MSARFFRAGRSFEFNNMIIFIPTPLRSYVGGRDSVDVDEFERAAATALADETPARLDLLMRAERLWGGEPLPEERYSDWAIPWRETLLDRYGAVLGLLVDAHLGRGDNAAAIEVARRLVALDPLGEGGHRTLMLAYARSGRRGGCPLRRGTGHLPLIAVR